VNAPNDRDKALERLLRQSMKTPRGSVTGSCLDPETLAVWAEGGLSGDELDAAQSHVAECARCQASLATLVQTSLREGVTVASARSEKTPRRLSAWLVPLTAAAAAIAIWIAVPRGPATQPQVAEVQSKPAQLKATEVPAPTPALQPPTTTKKEEQPLAAKEDQIQRDQPQASALAKDADRRELDTLKQQSQSAAAAGDRADKSRIAAEPSAPAVAPVAAAPPPQAAPAEARQAFQETSANAAAQKAAPARTAASTASAIRWRISTNALEHSTDSGSTWNIAVSVTDTQLTAVSSPSADVCWVVGRVGFVLRTQDGQHFSRVAFPEMTDLSSVQARDAQSATVTTRDGRRFTTSDGGATWQAAP
jgi:photosynthesis system II assembly factor YCF48-like protein